MIQFNANLNARNSSDGTVLYVASIRGYLDIVKLLLQAEADPNDGPSDGRIHLFTTHVEIIEELVKAGADPNMKISGINLLRHAVMLNRTDVVEALLKAGVNPNVQGILMNADNNSEITELLLYSGADFNTIYGNGDKRDALRSAMLGLKNLDVIRLLIPFLDQTTINNTGEYNSTYLYTASELGKPEIVKMLLDAGADPTIPNLWKNTPLQKAVHKGNLEVVKMLLDAGAIPDQHCIDIATRFNSINILELFEQHWPSLHLLSLRSIWLNRIDISLLPIRLIRDV